MTLESSQNDTLSQLLPFNEHRFDACLTYLAREHGKSLTQFDMVKLHVMIDVFHVLEHGTPVIGGDLWPWEHGAVVDRAYNRIMQWWYRLRETGEQPDNFHLEPYINKQVTFSPNKQSNYDDFSASEIEAMERAWDAIMTKDWTDSESYFHDPKNFMGRAWTNADAENRAIDWNEIISAYDAQYDEDHTHIKTLIRV